MTLLNRLSIFALILGTNFMAQAFDNKDQSVKSYRVEDLTKLKLKMSAVRLDFSHILPSWGPTWSQLKHSSDFKMSYETEATLATDEVNYSRLWEEHRNVSGKRINDLSAGAPREEIVKADNSLHRIERELRDLNEKWTVKLALGYSFTSVNGIAFGTDSPARLPLESSVVALTSSPQFLAESENKRLYGKVSDSNPSEMTFELIAFYSFGMQRYSLTLPCTGQQITPDFIYLKNRWRNPRLPGTTRILCEKGVGLKNLVQFDVVAK